MTLSERFRQYIPGSPEDREDSYWYYSSVLHDSDRKSRDLIINLNSQGVSRDEFGAILGPTRAEVGEPILRDWYQRAATVQRLLGEAHDSDQDPQRIIEYKNSLFTEILLMRKYPNAHPSDFFPGLTVGIYKYYRDGEESYPYHDYSLNYSTIMIPDPDKREESVTLYARVAELAPSLREATGEDIPVPEYVKELITSQRSETIRESQDDFLVRRGLEALRISHAINSEYDHGRLFDLHLLRAELTGQVIHEWIQRKKDPESEDHSTTVQVTLPSKKRKGQGNFVGIHITSSNGPDISFRSPAPWLVTGVNRKHTLLSELESIGYSVNKKNVTKQRIQKIAPVQKEELLMNEEQNGPTRMIEAFERAFAVSDVIFDEDEMENQKYSSGSLS
jgi:hypothetical protein